MTTFSTFFVPGEHADAAEEYLSNQGIRYTLTGERLDGEIISTHTAMWDYEIQHLTQHCKAVLR